MDQKGEILIYRSKQGDTKIDARLVNESLWLTQQQMADLFQTTKQNISLHLINIYKEGELDENSTVKDFLTVQKESLDLAKMSDTFKPPLMVRHSSLSAKRTLKKSQKLLTLIYLQTLFAHNL
jgi:hypothetical protein